MRRIPLPRDAALDMYDERNGFRLPPAPSKYDPAWLAGYRAAQRARAARIDAIARRHIEEAAHARMLVREPGFGRKPAGVIATL